MRKLLLTVLFALPFLMINHSAFAVDGVWETTTGKVTEFHQNSTGGDFYFKIDNSVIPANRAYLIADSTITGLSNGCTHGGNDRQYQVLVSMVMLAFSTGKSVEMRFCRTTDNYGIVTRSGAWLKVKN